MCDFEICSRAGPYAMSGEVTGAVMSFVDTRTLESLTSLRRRDRTHQCPASSYQ